MRYITAFVNNLVEMIRAFFGLADRAVQEVGTIGNKVGGTQTSRSDIGWRRYYRSIIAVLDLRRLWWRTAIDSTAHFFGDLINIGGKHWAMLNGGHSGVDRGFAAVTSPASSRVVNFARLDHRRAPLSRSYIAAAA